MPTHTSSLIHPNPYLGTTRHTTILSSSTLSSPAHPSSRPISTTHTHHPDTQSRASTTTHCPEAKTLPPPSLNLFLPLLNNPFPAFPAAINSSLLLTPTCPPECPNPLNPCCKFGMCRCCPAPMEPMPLWILPPPAPGVEPCWGFDVVVLPRRAAACSGWRATMVCNQSSRPESRAEIW